MTRDKQLENWRDTTGARPSSRSASNGINRPKRAVRIIFRVTAPRLLCAPGPLVRAVRIVTWYSDVDDNGGGDYDDCLARAVSDQAPWSNIATPEPGRSSPKAAGNSLPCYRWYPIRRSWRPSRWLCDHHRLCSLDSTTHAPLAALRRAAPRYATLRSD